MHNMLYLCKSRLFLRISLFSYLKLCFSPSKAHKKSPPHRENDAAGMSLYPIEKTFIKASRQIYKLISQQPQISAARMAEVMGLSTRQVQKYLRRLQELGKITRVGGRKIGTWEIIDEEYELFCELFYDHISLLFYELLINNILFG